MKSRAAGPKAKSLTDQPVAKDVLFYGDNLDILRERIAPGSVDLVYLDPPFNSNASYNVLFADKHGTKDSAQIHAFEDTWTWTQESERVYFDTITGGTVPAAVADAVQAMHNMIGENDLLAYLVMMAPRLVALHRVLKPTGSLYLHCDPTASHYLKLLLDSVFGPERFMNEIIWKRTSAHSSAKRYAPVHDVILFYAKSDRHAWNQSWQPLPQETIDQWYNNFDPDGRRFNRADLTAAGIRKGPSGEPWRGIDPTKKGRHWAIPGFVEDIVEGLPTAEALDALDAAGRLHWPKRKDGIPMLKRYIEEAPGIPALDVIADIKPLNNVSAERLGYPTQKPQALLERIIKASSNTGDVVLDPFCGCGTTVAAAQALGRRWLGIDITYLAIDLIRRRLEDTYGSGADFIIEGIPRDVEGAQALFNHNPLDFERWAVSLVFGQPNQKQVGDRGLDGVIRFPLGSKNQVGRALVSVKGGRQLNPAFVRDLKGTVVSEKAELGILVTIGAPTRGMVEAANRSGSYTWPVNGTKYPTIQIVTIEQLLAGRRPSMPPALSPYTQASRHVDRGEQLGLVSEEAPFYGNGGA